MTVTTVRCPTDTAKAGIDAMILLIRSHAKDRDPVAGTINHLLEMRHALDATD